MVIYCTHCGEVLPGKNARFCRHCGTLVPSHPLSFQSLTTPKDATPPSSAPAHSEENKPAFQEHTADPQLSQHDEQDESIRGSHEKELLADQKETHLSGQPPEKNDEIEEIEFRNTVALSAIQEQTAPDEDAEDIEFHDTLALSLPDERIKDIELHDTMALSLSREHTTPGELVEDIELHDTMALPLLREHTIPDEHAQDIEFHDTLAISALEQTEPQSQQTPLLPESETRTQGKDADHVPPQSVLSPERSSTPRQPVQGSSNVPPTSFGQDEMPPSTLVSAPPVQRSKRYFPLAIAVSLVVLLVGGIGAWLIIFQPFSVSPITDPTQVFKDTNLGVSLLYPTGWIVQRDRGTSLIHIHDSSQTAEVSIAVKNINTSNLTQILQKQTAVLGMTGIKQGPPISFAGASWQQIQGTVQQGGANYTGTIFATIRGGRLFMFVQQAHQSVYAQEDMLIFLPMRSSLQIF